MWCEFSTQNISLLLSVFCWLAVSFPLDLQFRANINTPEVTSISPEAWHHYCPVYSCLFLNIHQSNFWPLMLLRVTEWRVFLTCSEVCRRVCLGFVAVMLNCFSVTGRLPSASLHHASVDDGCAVPLFSFDKDTSMADLFSKPTENTVRMKTMSVSCLWAVLCL